jgi:hypothetical protein
MKPIDHKQIPLKFSETEYVGVQWAAKALGCGRSQILRYIEEGSLIAHKRGLTDRGWWHIRKESVMKLLESFHEQERAALQELEDRTSEPSL